MRRAGHARLTALPPMRDAPPMSHGASTMVIAGLGLIGLIQALPIAEQGLSSGALPLLAAGVPLVVLAIATRVRHVAVTHAAFPLSFVPLAVAAPELYTGNDWSGPGGLLTLLGAALALGVFLTAASPGPRLAVTPSGPPVARALVALLALSVAVPAVALWWPILAGIPGPPAVLFAATATIALLTVHVASITRGDLVASLLEPVLASEARGELQATLSRRKARTAIGLAFASLTLVAGLLWYLRRGFG
jgi:hypothetical protein